jgi:hypothetical protein
MTGPWEREDWLDESDWAAIEAALAGGDPGTDSVRAAVAALEVMTEEPVVSAGRLVNPLLDLWAAARVVGFGAAVPAEALLSVILGRTLIAASEVVSVCDRTMREVGQPPLSDPVLPRRARAP